MGVLSCDRRFCENIMCDYLSSEYGYLCYDCFWELVNKGRCDIQEFMNNSPNQNPSDNGWLDEVEREFKNRYGEDQ